MSGRVLNPIKGEQLPLPLLSPPEHTDLHDELARLELERDRLLKEGPVAPAGCWIETCRVAKRNFRQAYYRSTQPIFESAKKHGDAEAKVKRKYLGQAGSSEHKEAGNAIARRNALERIEKQIKLIEKQLED